MREPEPRGLGIPIITLLLEGGTDAIYKVPHFVYTVSTTVWTKNMYATLFFTKM